MTPNLAWVWLVSEGSVRANRIFKKLDIDDNGELDEKEFVRGCLDDADFIKLLTGDSGQTSVSPKDIFELDEKVAAHDL